MIYHPTIYTHIPPYTYIACAGLANKEAIDLLTPMLEDSVDFVRQGALIALAFVLQQTAGTV